MKVGSGGKTATRRETERDEREEGGVEEVRMSNFTLSSRLYQ